MRIQSYTPEMGDVKPAAQMEVDYCGKGHMVRTPLTLKTNRSIQFVRTVTAAQNPRYAGWNDYYVTDRGLEMLQQEYTISRRVLLD